MFTKYFEILDTWSTPNAVFISSFKVRFLTVLKDILLGTDGIVSVSYCYVTNQPKIQWLKITSVIIDHEPMGHLDSPSSHSQAHLYTCWPCLS